MSSWFGGPADNDRHRRHSSHHRHSSSRHDEDDNRSTTTIHKRPSSHHSNSRHRGSSPPKYAFVRSKSHTSPTRSASYVYERDRGDRDRGGSGGIYDDATRSFTSMFGTLSGGDRDRYATRGGSSSY